MAIERTVGRFVISHGLAIVVGDAHARRQFERAVLVEDGGAKCVLEKVQEPALTFENDASLGLPIDKPRLIGVSALVAAYISCRCDPGMEASSWFQLSRHGQVAGTSWTTSLQQHLKGQFGRSLGHQSLLCSSMRPQWPIVIRCDGVGTHTEHTRHSMTKPLALVHAVTEISLGCATDTIPDDLVPLLFHLSLFSPETISHQRQ